MLDKVYLGRLVSDLDIGRKTTKISKVTLTVDGNTFFTAGDDTGREIEKSVPWASQSMANDVLSAMKNIEYQPFSGTDALIDPSAEIGDGITVGGIYSILAQKNISYGKMSTSEIAAPGSDEIDDEYPYITKSQRLANRISAQTYSYIIKTSDEIKLGVANDLKQMRSEIDIQLDSITLRVENGLAGLSSEIKQTAESITLRVDNEVAGLHSEIKQTADSISLRITNEVEGLQSEIKQTASSIETQVKNAQGDISTLKQTATSLQTQITSANGNISTLQQTASSLSTQIKNAQGDISSLEQTASSLSTRITNANGAISSLEQYVDSFSLSVDNGQYSSTLRLMAGRTTLDSAEIEFTGMVTFSDLQGNRTIINGDVIDTSTLYLDSLYGRTIYLKDSYGYTVGYFSLTGSSSSYAALDLWSEGALRLHASSGDMFLSSDYGYVTLSSSYGITCANDLYPNSNGRYSCGTSSFKWSDIYANNDTIVTSDLQVKHDVEYGLDRYSTFFDNLRPISFLFNDGTSGRRHIGLGAQDVERALKESGLTDMDFAGFIKSPQKTEYEDEVYIKYNYALRYGEFVSLCIYQIQNLKSRVSELERMLRQ